MKKWKKVATMLVLAVVLGMLPGWSGGKVYAEGTIYTVKYIAEKDEWCFQNNYPWDDSVPERTLYYMIQELKDGDTLIVVGGTEHALRLEFTQRIGNVTVERAGGSEGAIVIHAGGIDECVILGGSVAAINGPVKKAAVYENAVVNFNNDVEELASYEKGGVVPRVRVMGTVAKYERCDFEGVFGTFYQFAKGKFELSDGDLMTEKEYYSKTPGAAAPASAPASSANASSGEYDDVPKTGDVSHAWLLAAAVLCFAGAFAQRMSKRS